MLQPTRWAFGPINVLLPIIVECLSELLLTAFSRIMQLSPISILPPSAIIEVPKSIH